MGGKGRGRWFSVLSGNGPNSELVIRNEFSPAAKETGQPRLYGGGASFPIVYQPRGGFITGQRA
jgi:hypothetical protein